MIILSYNDTIPLTHFPFHILCVLISNHNYFILNVIDYLDLFKSNFLKEKTWNICKSRIDFNRL